MDENKSTGEENVELPIETKSKKKPKWLKILEKQSWQAELVVSGLAIFGSLQLPSLVNGLVDYALFNFSKEYMSIFYFLFIYLYFASNLLIISFISHLALRSLWIGLLGLVSVYPKGVKQNFKLYSKDYMQKWKKEFPSLDDFNSRLDKSCSSIFAGSAIGAIVLLTIFLNTCFTLLIGALINWLIPSISVTSVLLFSLAILGTTMIVSMLLNLKQFREKEWVKKYQFPVMKTMSKYLYFFAYEPVNYVMMIFMTNATKKKLLSANTIILFITYITLIPMILNSDMMYFMNDIYFRRHTSPNYIQSSAYENLNTKTILRPMIQSDIIHDSAIRLFIPFPKREQIYADEFCGKYQKNPDLKRRENRRAESKFDRECAQKYFKVYLNNNLLTDLNFYKYEQPDNVEFGFITYIPTSKCQNFQNELRIESQLKNEETDKFWETTIPFIFER